MQALHTDTWDRDDTLAQALEDDEGLVVQIGQRTGGLFSDNPHIALTLALEPVDTGLRVTSGEQQWYNGEGAQIMVDGLIGFFHSFSSGRCQVAEVNQSIYN